MASFAAFLEVKGQRYPLLSYTLSIHQETDSLGRPASPTLGGTIDCVLSAPGADKSFLHQWMFSPTMQEDGRIILMSISPETTLRTISFFNAYCVNLQTNFMPSAGGGGSLQMSIRISPQRVAVGAIVHDNNWPVVSHGSGESFVRQQPQPKPKQGLMLPHYPDVLNPSKTPDIPKPKPTDRPPPSRTPPKTKIPQPQIPRDWSKLPRLASAALVFITALLYPHDAGVANEWVAQLSPEDEQRWQELEKKRQDLAKQGKVLPAHEYEEWLGLDTERFPYGRDGNGDRPRSKVGQTTAKTDALKKWEVKHSEKEADAICKYKQQMREEGIDSIKPIEVIEHNGKILVVDGHHRLAAAKELGITDVPVRYLSKDEFRQKAKRMGRFSTPGQLERIAEQNKNVPDIEASC